VNVRDNFGSIGSVSDVLSDVFVGIDDSLDNDDEAADSFEVEIVLGEGDVDDEADLFILMLDVEYDKREPCNERLE
jgi:hypothetical protein